MILGRDGKQKTPKRGGSIAMLAVELLSEPVVIPDTYSSGLSHIEDVGDGNLRFTFVVRQRSTYGGDEHNIVARLVLPRSAVHLALKTTMQALGMKCCGAGREVLTH